MKIGSEAKEKNCILRTLKTPCFCYWQSKKVDYFTHSKSELQYQVYSKKIILIHGFLN